MADSIKIGNLDISAFKVGSSDCKIYLGDTLLYPTTPPTPTFKWIATYTGGTTSSAECDSSSAITQNEINGTNLVSVEIGDCVASIGYAAFYDSSSLTSATIGNSVTSIGEGAFADCRSLTSIDIPDSVTTIGNSTFVDCSSLTSIDIPNSVTSIGSEAFGWCTSLTSITVNATTPPTLGFYAFDDTNDCPIYVPSGSVSAYQSAWSDYDYSSRIQAIPVPTPTLQWVTFSNGDTIPSDLDVYGVSGISQDLLDTYGDSGSYLQFQLSKSYVEFYIFNSDLSYCSDGSEFKTDPMEIIFSNRSCSDFINQSATVSGTIQLYIYA